MARSPGEGREGQLRRSSAQAGRGGAWREGRGRRCLGPPHRQGEGETSQGAPRLVLNGPLSPLPRCSALDALCEQGRSLGLSFPAPLTAAGG